MINHKKTLAVAACLLATGMAMGQVNMGQSTQKIHTYQIDKPEVDPIFFTGRVYQGAEGYIYPYPLYDKLTENQVEKEFNVLNLNNQYVNIDVLPEIGGRIFRAFDKTDNYPFFYTQTGIKPALIGMLGAWLSGGVEWNIPDHHRASSYMPVNWKMEENKDGSKTIWVGETELRHRLKWSVGVSVYPNRSWVEARIRVINPTSMIQSMLYWANVSVHCNEDYQVIFPSDVEFGVDHHKVYFMNWPYGEKERGGEEQMDLSWWKNFDLSGRSIFAYGSKMEFLAGYDYGKDAGTVHVANRHVVPGKKFFLWGNNPSGHMWNKILSDNDGHYLELMVGGYSDNQPDYSWINPGEIREFSQIWYPIKGIKGVKNATVDAAVNLEKVSDGKYRVGFCATTVYNNAKVVVKHAGKTVYEKIINIDPDKFFLDENVAISGVKADTELEAALYDAQGNELVAYAPKARSNDPLPKVIDGTKPVKEYKTVEELYLAGLRVDQFNNARLDYMDFYNEALLRDSLDARVNTEVGKHFIRRAEWEKAKMHLLRAKSRLAHDYTRVKDAECVYYLGNVYRALGKDVEAEESYWEATWTPAYKHRAFYELAVMATVKGNYAQASKMIEESLLVGAHDLQALTLKAYLQRKTGKAAEAAKTIELIKSIDPLDYWSSIETSFLNNNNAEYLKSDLAYRNQGIIGVQELLEVANNYMSIGDYAAALTLIDNAVAVGEPYASYPLVQYYKAYNEMKKGNKQAADEAVAQAEKMSALNNFPLRVEEVELFNTLIAAYPASARLLYYRGDLLYYIGQKDAALADWEASVKLDATFALSCRNVGFAYGQKKDYETAIKYYDMAIKNNPNDALMFTESDKLYEAAGRPIAQRLKRLEANKKTVLTHDDAVMRLISLYNESGLYDKAIALMDNRHFHLWEGGGEIHQLYTDSHFLKGMNALNRKSYKVALKEFDLANQYPSNLEVAPSAYSGYGPKANYLSGLASEGLGQKEQAQKFYEEAAAASKRLRNPELTYFKAQALRKIGKIAEADKLAGDFKNRINEVKAEMEDSYAKFGDANKNARLSTLKYYEGLRELLDNNNAAAKQCFSEAVSLNASNLWAKAMLSQVK